MRSSKMIDESQSNYYREGLMGMSEDFLQKNFYGVVLVTAFLLAGVVWLNFNTHKILNNFLFQYFIIKRLR